MNATVDTMAAFAVVAVVVAALTLVVHVIFHKKDH